MHLPDLRPRLFAALAAAAALCTALPALAAQVTDVRVGVHPKFTRIVFELDGRAGYQVERVGNEEVRITIEASSSARELRANGDVRGVKVDAGTKARAHIALRGSDLRLHEMMLSNPPRIVLDLWKPETAVAAASKPAPERTAAAPAAKPKAEAKQTTKPEAKETAKPEAKESAKAEAKRAPTPEAAPKPKVAPTPPAPVAPKTAAAPPTPAPAPKEAAPAPPTRAPTSALNPAPRVTPEPSTPVPSAKPAAPPATSPTKPAPESEHAATPPTPAPMTPVAPPPAVIPAPTPVPAPTPESVAKPSPPAPVPPLPIPSAPPAAAVPGPSPLRPAPEPHAPPGAPPAAGESWSDRLIGDSIWLGGIVAALLGLGAIALVMRRRRALPNDLDVTAIAEEVERTSDAPGRIPSGGFAMGDDQTSSARPDESSSLADLFDAPVEKTAPVRPAFQTPAAPIAQPTPAAAAAENSLFDDAGEMPGEPDASEGDSAMDQEMDLPVDRPTSSPPTARMGGSAALAPDLTRMFQDLERRIATLEARLDESNEAREKLERQVAAQSEELRVQRAAIARTQRALRTMTRGDEDKATEPALRDGDTQAKTRVTP